MKKDRLKVLLGCYACDPGYGSEPGMGWNFVSNIARHHDVHAIVGSANMDYRSMYLHFENCCSFYGGGMVQDVKRDFEQTLEQCGKVTMEQVKSTPLYKRVFQLIFRIWSPMM